MKVKTLLLPVIAVAIIIICFVVYNTYTNTEVESEQMAVVFSTDKMGLIETFEGTINDLYKEMQVKAKTAEEEPDIQEMAEAVEIENEEILLTDESTENPSGGEELTATQPKPAPKPEGDSSDNTGGGSGGGSGLTPEQQAYLDALKGGGTVTTGTSAGDAPSGPAWTMAQ